MTEVTLKEYIEMRLNEQDRRIEQARASMEEARKVLEYSTGKRLDLLNEFRAQAADESKKYSTREMHESAMHRLSGLEKDKERVYGAILIVSLLGVANLVKLFW